MDDSSSGRYCARERISSTAASWDVVQLISKPLKNSDLWLRSGLTGVLALMLASLWFPPQWFWGINHGIWLPWPLSLGFPVAGLLLAWSPAGTRFGSLLTGPTAVRLWNRPEVLYGLIPAVGAAAFWFLREKTHMLGDGQTLAVMLAGDHLYHGFDFMTFHLLAKTYQWAGAGGEASAFTVAAIFSCLSGAAYLAAAAWAARRLTQDPSGGILLYLLLIFSTPLLLFFGYTEVYAPLTVAMLFFVTSLIRYREGRGQLLTAAVAWAVGLFFHLNALFLAPLLVVSVLKPGRNDSSAWPRRLLTVVRPPLVAIVAAGLLLLASGYDAARFQTDFGHVGQGQGILLDLTGPDGLLTGKHLKDILNLLLLLAPAPLLMLAVGFRKENRPFRPTVTYLASGCAFLILLMSLVHLKLGAVRDWDLFAPHASLFILTGWIAIGSGPTGAIKPSLVGRLVAVAMALTLPWLLVNLSPARSLARLEAVSVDLSPYARGLLHEQFAYHHQLNGDQDEVTRHYRKCGEVCPSHPRFHAIYGTYQLNQRNLPEAVAAFDRAVAADSTYVYGLKMNVLARVINADYAGALEPARQLARRGGQDAEAAAAHGMAAQQLGLWAEAEKAYLAGFAFDRSRLDLLEKGAVLQLVQGQNAAASNNFRKILAAQPRQISAAYGLADALWKEYLADPPDLDPVSARSRLGEVVGLITRVQGAGKIQGIKAETLSEWKLQVEKALAQLD